MTRLLPKPLLFAALAVFLTLGPATIPPALTQGAGHHYVDKLVLGNCGDRPLRGFQIHWQDGGARYSRQVRRIVSPGHSTCFDLGTLAIPTGASVSLSYEISAGARDVCDIGHSDLTYAPTSHHSQLFISGSKGADFSHCQAFGSIRAGGSECPASNRIICPSAR